jgi:formylglycine-generating enzyme required for sulfatase activity
VVLGRLGDPRNGAGLRTGVPDIGWVEVPGGPFTMGSRHWAPSYSDETPQFTCRRITRPYLMARYPVTVVQYRVFVDHGGYRQRRWWTDAGWNWKESLGSMAPEDYEEVYQTANHPRVGVSWYEATAYCCWLGTLLRLPVRLPSEAEWERAARGPDGSVYPWGSQADCAARCNLEDTGIGHTSAVGLFPTGNAKCGAADMAGNVWEWCGTKWRGDYEEYERQADDDPAGDEHRVLRGGSWSNDRELVRGAARLKGTPFGRFKRIGFRVVAPRS